MDINKDQLVADFQACTGFDDFGLTLKYLEESNWNLIDAVNKAFSNETENTSHNQFSSQNQCKTENLNLKTLNFYVKYIDKIYEFQMNDNETVGNLKYKISTTLNFPKDQILLTGWFNNVKVHENTFFSTLNLPSDNHLNLVRTQTFEDFLNNKIEIKIKNNCIGELYSIKMDRNKTLYELKMELLKFSHIPCEFQLIVGMPKESIVNDQMTLETCGFETFCNLEIYDTRIFGNDIKPNKSHHYPIEIDKQSSNTVVTNTNTNNHGSLNNSNLPTTTTSTSTTKSAIEIIDLTANPFLALKHPSTSNIVDIDKYKDNTHPSAVSTSSSSFNPNNLSHNPTAVSTVNSALNNSNNLNNNQTVDRGSNNVFETISDHEEYLITSSSEDEDDDIIIDDNADHFLSCSSSNVASNTTPLIPPNSEDNAITRTHFVEQFEKRYGRSHPTFFTGSMQQALNASCNLPILERKLLAIYLHNDKSILSNIFCSLNLCSDAIVNFLNSNFIIWPWDMTDESNRETFLTLATNKFGKTLETTLRKATINEYPVIVIIQKTRGQYDILNIFKGSACMNDLMTSLLQTHDMFQHYQENSLQDELDRDTRERIKREQDEAFTLSLQADKAKKFAKEREFEQEQLIQQIKDEEDEFKMKEKEAIRMSLADTVPPEPPKDTKLPVTTIKLRIVTQNKMIQRRFLADDKLQTLFNYIASLGFDKKEYCYMTHWPTADITLLDPEGTLRAYNLYPQVSLTITERLEDTAHHMNE